MSDQTKEPEGLRLPDPPQGGRGTTEALHTQQPPRPGQGRELQDTDPQPQAQGLPDTDPQPQARRSRAPLQESYLMEAANGMLVSVPADRLESWQKAQDEIRKGNYKPEEELKSRIMSTLLGSKDSPR